MVAVGLGSWVEVLVWVGEGEISVAVGGISLGVGERVMLGTGELAGLKVRVGRTPVLVEAGAVLYAPLHNEQAGSAQKISKTTSLGRWDLMIKR
jgi:hypothetical protein